MHYMLLTLPDDYFFLKQYFDIARYIYIYMEVHYEIYGSGMSYLE